MNEPGAPPTADPIDWAGARRVARLVAGRDAFAESYLGASLAADFAAVTAEAEALVGEHTGLVTPGRARADVVDRHGWIDANLESLRRLVGPIVARVSSRLGGGWAAPVARRAAGAELGALLGYLAKRVLGQYDLLVPDESGDLVGDSVHYVGPNVLSIEKRFAFRPLDFRRWIAIHELTHRAQFTGVPWMRAHYLGLVERALQAVDPDPLVVVRALRNTVDELRHGRNPLDHGLVGLVASAEQRAVLMQVQALMSLLEGHGNAVMQDLGRRHVHGEERMARVLQSRRRASGATLFLHRLLGFDAKLRQYETGERFVRGVLDEAGPNGLDPAWSAPEMLPTLGELERPVEWLARVDAARPSVAG